MAKFKGAYVAGRGQNHSGWQQLVGLLDPRGAVRTLARKKFNRDVGELGSSRNFGPPFTKIGRVVLYPVDRLQEWEPTHLKTYD
jgi:hypothetical protein